MGKQKEAKRLRKLAKNMQGIAHTGTQALPEAYMQDGRRTLNPGKPKGTYKWLKKNADRANRK